MAERSSQEFVHMAAFDGAARMGLKGLLRKVRKFSQGHDFSFG
jgi:hypothetical protein